VRGTESQRLTAESAAPAASVCSMACFMASHACLALPLPLPLLNRVALLPNPTPIAHTGTVSTFDSLSPHLIGGLLELCIEAGERAHDGPESRCTHRSLTQTNATSARGPCGHARLQNTAARRSVLPTSRGRAFESPARWALSATTLHRWLKSVGLGGHWLGLDVPSTNTACGVIGDATVTSCELW
jgi:hypothetical protein